MKKVEFLYRQGDVYVYKVDQFPEGPRVQDELTKKGQLALGELSGHHHAIPDLSSVEMFKMPMPEYEGITFLRTNKDTVMRHGLIPGFKGREADQEYHSEILLKGNTNYITTIVEETDWLTKTIRKVID